MCEYFIYVYLSIFLLLMNGNAKRLCNHTYVCRLMSIITHNLQTDLDQICRMLEYCETSNVMQGISVAMALQYKNMGGEASVAFSRKLMCQTLQE